MKIHGKTFTTLLQSHGMSCWLASANMMRQFDMQPSIDDKIANVVTAKEGERDGIDIQNALLSSDQKKLAKDMSVTEDEIISMLTKEGLSPREDVRRLFFNATGLEELSMNCADWMYRRRLMNHHTDGLRADKLFTTNHWAGLVNMYGPLWCPVRNGCHIVVIVGTEGGQGLSWGDGDEWVDTLELPADREQGYPHAMTSYQRRIYKDKYAGPQWHPDLEKKDLARIKKQFQLCNDVSDKSYDGYVVLADPAINDFRKVETTKFNIWYKSKSEATSGTDLARIKKYGIRRIPKSQHQKLEAFERDCVAYDMSAKTRSKLLSSLNLD